MRVIVVTVTYLNRRLTARAARCLSLSVPKIVLPGPRSHHSETKAFGTRSSFRNQKSARARTNLSALTVSTVHAGPVMDTK